MNPETPPLAPATGCPDPIELAQWIDGVLPEERRGKVHLHLQQCKDCSELVGISSLVAATVKGEPTDLTLDEPAVSSDSSGRDLAEIIAKRHGGRLPEPMPLPPRSSSESVESITPDTRRHKRRSWVWIPAALAASLAMLVVFRPFGPTGARGKRILVSDLTSAGKLSLNEDWPSHGWRAMRGVRGHLSEEQTAFRVGVWMTDLHVALANDDRHAAQQALAQLNVLLETIEFAEPSLLYYAEVRRQLEEGVPTGEIVAISDEAERFFDSMELVPLDRVALGKWTEAVQLATNRNDVAYLQEGIVSRVGDELREIFDTDDAGKVLAQVTKRLGGPLAPGDLEAVRQHLGKLLSTDGGSD
jgi:hypothetical protein